MYIKLAETHPEALLYREIEQAIAHQCEMLKQTKEKTVHRATLLYSVVVLLETLIQSVANPSLRIIIQSVSIPNMQKKLQPYDDGVGFKYKVLEKMNVNFPSSEMTHTPARVILSRIAFYATQAQLSPEKSHEQYLALYAIHILFQLYLTIEKEEQNKLEYFIEMKAVFGVLKQKFHRQNFYEKLFSNIQEKIEKLHPFA